MAPKKRKPLSLRPKYFGIHDSFAQAFPTIASVVVVVEIDGHHARGMMEPRRFDESNLPEIVDCPDPNCGGGFQTSVVAPVGVCVTQFNYVIDIVYK